ncbi:MAG TPA: alpha-L-arabinofuranosidase C-terminal domain-containing protein [Bryobacteraceae bacterium]|jgi:alpha-N-arabinofuranosidase
MKAQYFPAVGAILFGVAAALHGQGDAIALHIKADQVTAKVNPAFYGLMTEEINYSYDGGLYGELVRNRNFKEDAKEPVHWQLIQEAGGVGSMALDATQPLNDAAPASLKLTISQASGNARVGAANEGFWGIPVKPGTSYKVSIYAKAAESAGPVTVSLVSNDGATTKATAQIARVGNTWTKYDVKLTAAAGAKASADNKLVLSVSKPGTIWFGFVSLFPPTFKNRANGNRPDIMQLLADMKPGFLRFPGGNYLEGNTIQTRFDWKKTIGDVSQRPGHMDDAWKYWSSDGMGLLDFLDWCEDLNMQPLLAVYAGYSLRQERVKFGPDLDPYVKDALDEIEYVTGDASTTWGARRAKDGHPAPFKLEYVEIGNEDNFDREQGSYEGRFAQIFDAIKAKYPQLKLIATTPIKNRVPDVIDEHYYRRSEEEMASHAHDYDMRPRAGPKVFVGEWATRVGSPTPNMGAALGDAAWMAGMERNADLVIMEAYAPLLVNVNPGGMQWMTDLIGYNTTSSYGSPAYYAQQMFSTHHGDNVLAISEQGVPTREWTPPAGRGAAGQPPRTPMPQQVPLLFFNATRDSKTGTIYVKVVNRAATAQTVHLAISGLTSVQPGGKITTMAASSPDDTNSITEPKKVAPVTSNVNGLGPNFTRDFPPYSISVLELTSK